MGGGHHKHLEGEGEFTGLPQRILTRTHWRTCTFHTLTLNKTPCLWEPLLLTDGCTVVENHWGKGRPEVAQEVASSY